MAQLPVLRRTRSLRGEAVVELKSLGMSANDFGIEVADKQPAERAGARQGNVSLATVEMQVRERSVEGSEKEKEQGERGRAEDNKRSRQTVPL
jgi:hypothetical protein